MYSYVFGGSANHHRRLDMLQKVNQSYRRLISYRHMEREKKMKYIALGSCE